MSYPPPTPPPSPPTYIDNVTTTVRHSSSIEAGSLCCNDVEL